MCARSVNDQSLGNLARILGPKKSLRKLSIANASSVTNVGMRILGEYLKNSLIDINLFGVFRYV